MFHNLVSEPEYGAILKRAVKLVPTHGFSRETLALSTISVGRESRLSETAISALFGHGDEATRTLIKAWMEEGREDIRLVASESAQVPNMQDVLLRRLRWNESALPHLKDAFALMSTSRTPTIPLLVFRPAFTHAFEIANDACNIVPSPPSIPSGWYTRRATIGVIYAASELHQLTSPQTAPAFLNSLLSTALESGKAVNDIGLYAEFIAKGWAGMLKGRGFS